MIKKPDHKETSLTRSSAAEYLTFITAKGEGGVEAIYADEDVWLSQKMMAVLYDVDVRTINYHLRKVFKDSELAEESVIRKFRITAADGKNYDTGHYNLSAIIAVGYKVNSERAVQFRKWATTVVKEFTVKGFAMDDERLKAGGTVLTRQYFEEQLQRVREIRLSERKFYQKITDIYASAIDYDRSATATQRFFATVQNKLHWAIHGHTAAEVIVDRADAGKQHMGLTTWKDAPHGKIQKFDVSVAKNYLTEPEMAQLSRLRERLPRCRRRHGPAADPHDHAGLGNTPQPLHRSHRPGNPAGRRQSHRRNRQGPRRIRVREIPHRPGSPVCLGLRRRSHADRKE